MRRAKRTCSSRSRRTSLACSIASEKLAHADIDIHHLYATASAAQAQCLVVFATANNDRAMVLLNAL
jgi:hypothetical protein